MQPFHQALAPDVARLAPLRQSLSSWLEEADVADPPRGELVLATHEAATNAIQYGAPKRPFEVRGSVVDRVVTVAISNEGRWNEIRRENDDRGRGLALIEAIVTKVEIETDRSGTTVRLVQTF